MNTYEVDILLAGTPVGHVVLTSVDALGAISQAEYFVANAIKQGQFEKQIKSQFLIANSPRDFNYEARRQS